MSASKVTTNFLIVYLGVVFLTHYTLGNVIPDGTVYEDNNSTIKSTHVCKETLPKEHFEKFEKLSKFTRQELSTFTRSTLGLVENFIEKLIEGGIETAWKESLEPFKKLSQELTEREKADDIFNVFGTEEKAYNLLKQYNVSSVGQPHTEVNLNADILNKFGLETLEKQVLEAGKKLMQSFSTKVLEYQRSLTNEEHEKDKNFENWLAKLNEEQDHGKQINLFKEFFELYCSSNTKTI